VIGPDDCGEEELLSNVALHHDLTTTQRYMHLTPAALEAAIGSLNKPNPIKQVRLKPDSTTWR
jgi:hypothetical protein